MTEYPAKAMKVLFWSVFEGKAWQRGHGQAEHMSAVRKQADERWPSVHFSSSSQCETAAYQCVIYSGGRSIPPSELPRKPLTL